MLSSLISALKPRTRRDHLLIACMPKSGSTYLHTVLREITGLGDAYVSEWGEQNEGDICERRLRRLRRRSVMHQHVKATQTNLKWMLKYGVRPIVQTRSLFDVVPSIHDHLEQSQGGLPCGYDCQEFWSRNWNDRLDFLIHMHLPWYFNFLLSWREAASEIEICPISYEDLFADQVGSLTRILDFFRVPASQEQIVAAIARASRRNTRFNMGVSGRGNRVLTSRHKQAIRNLAVVGGFELSETGRVVSPFSPRQSAVERSERVARIRDAA
jgi:hypothetical protein